MESPCILICSIDRQSGYCHGCGRTTDEIGAWTMYTDERRKELMEELPGRLSKLEKKPRRETKRRKLAKARDKSA